MVCLLLNNFIATDVTAYHSEQLVPNNTIELEHEYTGAIYVDYQENNSELRTTGWKDVHDNIHKNGSSTVMLKVDSRENALHHAIPAHSYNMTTPSNAPLHNDLIKLEKLIQRCSTVRPAKDEIKYMNKYWQVFDQNETYISMYSAFYDHRSIQHDLHYVYINAVAKQLSHHRQDETISTIVVSPYHCQVWYEGYSHPLTTSMLYVRNEFLRSIDNVMYSTYMLACPLQIRLVRPTHVSITRYPCDQTTTYLTVYDVTSDHQQHEFGICTAVGFGAIPSEHMVEWFEFHQLLGVSEINIYDAHMRGLKKVFRHYQDLNLLAKKTITSPIPSSYISSIQLASQVVLNDCMMRNQNRYRYIVIVDFDEIMWPNVRANFSRLLQTIDKIQNVSHPWQSYTFHNAYHMLNFPEDLDQPEYLRSMRFRYRKPPTPFPLKTKSIIDPSKCIIVFHHACIMFSDPDVENTVTVDPSIAMSHHYRRCPTENTECNTMQSRPDDDILQYKDDLQQRVHVVLGKLRLL
jgi:hypothetical protein